MSVCVRPGWNPRRPVFLRRGSFCSLKAQLERTEKCQLVPFISHYSTSIIDEIRGFSEEQLNEPPEHEKTCRGSDV